MTGACLSSREDRVELLAGRKESRHSGLLLMRVDVCAKLKCLIH